MKDNLKRWFYRIAIAIAVMIVASALAYSLPIDLAMLLAVDVTAYFEAVLAVYIMSRTAPWRMTARSLWRRAQKLGRRHLRRPHGREHRDPSERISGTRNADNDDDRPERVLLAA